jgi:hypothetical protein
MADDAARIAQLEAEARALRVVNASLRAENGDLRGDLSEALEQQTATAEELWVIANSPADLQRVLHEVAQSAMRHSHSTGGGLCLYEGDTVRTVALAGVQARVPAAYVGEVNPVTMSRPGGRAMLERRTIHIPDRTAPAARIDFPDLDAYKPVATLTVPLLRENEAIGFFHVGRDRAEGYSPREIALAPRFGERVVTVSDGAPTPALPSSQ